MSDSVGAVVGDVLRVLVVGESAQIDATATALSAAFDAVSVLRERSVEDARDRLAATEIHCLVCAYDQSADRSAFDRLRSVEQKQGDDQSRNGGERRASALPIVAVVEESMAEAALDAGATDVLSPETADALVATRIRNAAERYRLATQSTDRRYRSVLDGTTAIVFVVDAAGAIDYVNAAVDEQMGYTPAELERTTLFRLVHPDDQATVEDTLDEAAGSTLGATVAATVRLGYGDGTWRVAELRVVNRQADPTVAGLVVTVADSTPEGAAAETVTDAVDRLDAAFFAVGPQWELQFANAAGERLLSPSATERRADRDPNQLTEPNAELPTDSDIDRPTDSDVDLPTDSDADLPTDSDVDRLTDLSIDVPTAGKPDPGTIIWELLPDAVHSEFADRLREAAATDAVVEFETVWPSIEGRLAVTAAPSTTGVSVTARKISPDETAAADRDRLEQFESIVDALDDGVVVLENDTITYANPAVFDLVRSEPLVGREIDSLVDEKLGAAIRERADSPLVRWMEPLSGTIESNGDRRPVDVSVMPLGSDDPNRTCCVIRDRRGTPAAAVSMLASVGTALLQADSDADIRATLVDAVRSYTAADVAVWYRVDESVIRPAAVRTATPAADAELPSIDRRGDPLSAVLDTEGVTVSDREEIEPFCSRSGIRADRVLTVPIGDGFVLATSTDLQGFDGIDLDPIETLATIAELALDRHATERHNQALERDRQELDAAIEQVNAVQDLAVELINAETRPTVEQRLAEGLISLETVESDGSIELAWVGETEIGSDIITPRTWAGRDGEFLESRTISVGSAETDAGEPAGRTAASREPTLVDAIEGDDPEPWQQLALDRGFQSMLSVPLLYDDFYHGTVTLYADRPAAFDDRTLASCVFLATVAGYVSTAIERKRALVSNEVTELEIAISVPSEPLSSLAHSLESRLDLRTIVPRSGGGTAIFCTIGVADEERIREAVTASDGIDSVRFVGEPRGALLVELVCTDTTVAETLAEFGGVLRSVAPAGSRSRLVVELSTTIDVRSFVETLGETFPKTELIARREHDQTTRHERSFESELRDRLSERQLRTLETAYYSGFFEWPRESTGEEVADSLGVSQPTFSRHFRLAQHKLFTLLFEPELDE